MSEKIIPISFQLLPNSKSALAVVHTDDDIKVIKLTKEDIASLRENIISYYKNLANIPEEYQPDFINGVKPKIKNIRDNKNIAISAELYKDFQQLYNENFRLKRDLKYLRNENHQLRKALLHKSQKSIFSKKNLKKLFCNELHRE